MKRRNFLKNATAFASAPLLPLKLAASPLPVSPEQYAKAVHWAGLWVHSTAATYKNMLGVDLSVGEAVFQRLQNDGIVGAVDASGIARAVVPHYELPEVAARLKKTMAKPSAPKSVLKTTPKKDLPKIHTKARRKSKHTDGEDDVPTSQQLDTATRPAPRPSSLEERPRISPEA